MKLYSARSEAFLTLSSVDRFRAVESRVAFIYIYISGWCPAVELSSKKTATKLQLTSSSVTSDWERERLNLNFGGHCGHATQPLQVKLEIPSLPPPSFARFCETYISSISMFRADICLARAQSACCTLQLYGYEEGCTSTRLSSSTTFEFKARHVPRAVGPS